MSNAWGRPSGRPQLPRYFPHEPPHRLRRITAREGRSRRAHRCRRVPPGPAGGGGAPARELHRQPVRGHRGIRRPGLRPLRPRSRRDPDLPDRRRRAPSRISRASRAGARAHARRKAGAAARARPQGRRARRRRGARDHAARRGLRGGGGRVRAPVRGQRVPRPHRLEGGDALGAGRRRDLALERPGDERERRASGLSEGPAQLAVRRLPGDRERGPRRVAGSPALDRRRRSGPPRRRRLRGPDRAGRGHTGCPPHLASRRHVLGGRARTDSRAREGDGRCVSRRHAWEAAARVHARRHRHRGPHGRRVRDRLRDARPLAVHRSRTALSLAHARVRPSGRGRRHRRAASAPARATRPTITTTTTTTTTITTITATVTTTITTTTR